MDPKAFKSTTVSRGLTYEYYFSSPSQAKPYLVFLHGWPSTSFDWRRQVVFFKERGFGLIVPSMLGYGGTSKPTDPLLYKSSLICKDIIDVLDAEGVEKAVVIGHDWGSKIASRLANYFPDRFTGFGFLAVGYAPPEMFATPYSASQQMMKAVFGYEVFGYWDFLSQPNAPALIESRLESFFRLAFTQDDVLTITDWSPYGALEAWLKADKRGPLPDWLTDEEFEHEIKAFSVPGSIEAGLNWYKIVTSSVEKEDNEGIPPNSLSVKKPVFFGGALKDFVTIAPIMASATLNNCTNATIRLYPTHHWVQLESKELNNDLLVWIEGLTS